MAYTNLANKFYDSDSKYLSNKVDYSVEYTETKRKNIRLEKFKIISNKSRLIVA